MHCTHANAIISKRHAFSWAKRQPSRTFGVLVIHAWHVGNLQGTSMSAGQNRCFSRSKIEFSPVGPTKSLGQGQWTVAPLPRPPSRKQSAATVPSACAALGMCHVGCGQGLSPCMWWPTCGWDDQDAQAVLGALAVKSTVSLPRAGMVPLQRAEPPHMVQRPCGWAAP